MATKTKRKLKTEDLQDAFIKAVNRHGKMPETIFSFMEGLERDEAEFYEFYGSFSGLENDIWKSFIERTVKLLEADDDFQEFGPKEKLLAFYYTHLEVLLQQRSYVVFKLRDIKKPHVKTPSWITGYKDGFLEFANQIIKDAISQDEIVGRPFLSEKYDQVFWLQLLFILDYWSKDESAKFEDTDGVIEKSVDLSFKILGETALDAAVDFAKHIWKSM